MRKLFLFACLLHFSFATFSQDTLFLLNQSKIICKVHQVNIANVVYVKNDTAVRKPKEILLPRGEVRCIVYGDGNLEIISVKKIKASEINSMFLKGSQDATAHYKHPGGSIGTGVASFLTGGIIGLIPAIACSATTPKMINLGLTKESPIRDKDYMLGYAATAKKMKQKKVWTSYTLGVLSAVAFLLITKH